VRFAGSSRGLIFQIIVKALLREDHNQNQGIVEEMDSGVTLYAEESQLANAMCRKVLASAHPVYAGRMIETREVPDGVIETVKQLITLFDRMCGKCERHIWFIGGNSLLVVFII